MSVRGSRSPGGLWLPSITPRRCHSLAVGAQCLFSSRACSPGSDRPRGQRGSDQGAPLTSALISAVFLSLLCWFILSTHSAKKYWACWVLGGKMSKTEAPSSGRPRCRMKRSLPANRHHRAGLGLPVRATSRRTSSWRACAPRLWRGAKCSDLTFLVWEKNTSRGEVTFPSHQLSDLELELAP